MVRRQCFGDLVADAHDWVQGGHRLLKDHGDGAAAQGADGGFAEQIEALAGEGNGAADAGVWRQEAEKGERGGGLAGAGFSDKAERLAGSDGKGEVVDDGASTEGYGEVGHFEEGGFGHGVRRRGNSVRVARFGQGRVYWFGFVARLTREMMRRGLMLFGVVGGLASNGVLAQTHVIKKPETVVRAVAVYEWMGEEGKATASRVVPVSVFINGQLEDAGVYMARPVPFALGTGTVFEMEKAGTPEGTLELAYARHYVSSDTAPGISLMDDGWLGYGAFKPTPKDAIVAAKKSGPLPQMVVNGGDRPHFSNHGASAGKSDPTSSASDQGDTKKPVDRSGAAGAGTTVSAQDDPGKPTMRRRDNADASGTDSDSAKDNPDRPTLKKRSPAEDKAAQKKKDLASVTGSGTLNDDPDRPMLHRGAPTSRLDEDQLPPLRGLPKDMHQMVAVSDASNRPEHDFKRVWESGEEQAEVTGKLEALARAKLAEYDVPVALAVQTSSAPLTKIRPGAASKSGRRAPAPASANSVVLMNETLNAFTLSYGGAATYVFSAASAGAGGAIRYVSLVTQREQAGELKTALTSVTDTKHLDRTPWMRLVDAVDAEASNRASLLFELRGQSSRQFALYRVIGAAAEQTFVTATPE